MGNIETLIQTRQALFSSMTDLLDNIDAELMEDKHIKRAVSYSDDCLRHLEQLIGRLHSETYMREQHEYEKIVGLCE